jgi:hypothetical protein
LRSCAFEFWKCCFELLSSRVERYCMRACDIGGLHIGGRLVQKRCTIGPTVVVGFPDFGIKSTRILPEGPCMLVSRSQAALVFNRQIFANLPTLRNSSTGSSIDLSRYCVFRPLWWAQHPLTRSCMSTPKRRTSSMFSAVPLFWSADRLATW